MEGSFEELLVFDRMEPRNVHNKMPLHMSSVAGGVRKRLQDSIQRRKSVRLSSYDQGRDIAQEVRPTPIKEVRSEAELKVEHRRQQLEKWKVQKAQRKKEEAMAKKKPFVAGIPHAPLYVLPPPPSKPAPSTSGRVTRSTARKAAETKPLPQTTAAKKPETLTLTKFFAPKNATFKAPQIKNAITLPPFILNRTKPKTTITFNPIVHPTRPNPNTSSTTSGSEGSSTMLLDDKPKRKFVKTPMKFPKHMTSSDSDSDHHVQNRAVTKKAQLQTQTTQTSSDTDNSSSSKQADAKPTKKVATKPSPHHMQASKPEPNLAKRPTRAAKLKALTSIEEQRLARKNKIKVAISQKTQKTPQVVDEHLPMDYSKSKPSTSKATPDCVKPKRPARKSDSSTPTRPIPKSESSSEERMRLGTPKNAAVLSSVMITPTNLDSSSSTSNLSPFVCLSRGKDNARKEMIQKAKEGLLGAELEAEEDSVSYFRQLLDTEIQRITLACDLWDTIYKERELPEFVQGLVLSAVGQGRLLMAQKFRQFVSLIDQCASAAETVTVTDLRGFWDMIYLQVKNIDHRFAQLEELRAKNWSLELHQSQQRPAAKAAQKPAKKPGDPAKKKTAAGSRKSTVTAGSSKIKEMIAAARKAKQQQDSSTYSTSSSTTTLTTPEEEKTFEAGFFSVRSPIRTPTTPATPAANRSLLKSVLSSEARKACGSCSKNTSNAMLRASILGKNIQIEGVSPLENTPKPIPINLNATPARSILKSGQKKSFKKSTKKSIKTVLFDQIESDDSTISNLTLPTDPTELTTDINKENEASTDSVNIIISIKKSSIKKIEVATRKSTETAKKSIDQSTKAVKSTKKSDKKPSVTPIETVKTKSTGNKNKLERQNASTSSPIMTRRQRKSLQPFLVDDLAPQHSVLKELDNLTPNSTSTFDVFDASKDIVSSNPTPRRSKRLTQINSEDDLIKFDSPVKIVAGRSSKRRADN